MSTRRQVRGVLEHLLQQMIAAANARAGANIMQPISDKYRILTELLHSNENADAKINANITNLVEELLYFHRIRSSNELPVALRSAIVNMRRQLLDGNAISIDTLFSVLPQEILAAYSMFFGPIEAALRRKFPNGIDKYDFFLLGRGREFVEEALGFKPSIASVLSRIPAMKYVRAGRNAVKYMGLTENNISSNLRLITENNVPPEPEAAGGGGEGGQAVPPEPEAVPALAVRPIFSPHGVLLRPNSNVSARNRSNSTNSFVTAAGSVNSTNNNANNNNAQNHIEPDAPSPLYRLNNVLRRGVNPLIAARRLKVLASVGNAPSPVPDHNLPENLGAAVANTISNAINELDPVRLAAIRRNSTNSNNLEVAPVPKPGLTLRIPRNTRRVNNRAAPPPGLTLRIPPVAPAKSNGFFKRLKKTLKKKKSPFTNK